MRGIGVLAPGFGQFLEYSSIIKFAVQYKSNVGDLALELKQMKSLTERKTADNTMSVFGKNTFMLLVSCNFVSKYDVIVIVNSRFLERPQKRSHRNQLIHRRLTKTKSIGIGQDPESQAGRQTVSRLWWMVFGVETGREVRGRR